MAAAYSSLSDMTVFLEKIGNNPLFVNDLDGNIMNAFALAPGSLLPLTTTDNPRLQAIPFGMSSQEIEHLVEKRVLKRAIFAERNMDVRLPQCLVHIVNNSIAIGAPGPLAFLTSRGDGDALKLFAESGVHYPECATLATDSGATLNLHGERLIIRGLKPSEQDYLASIPQKHQSELDAIVRQTLSGYEFDADRAPPVTFEMKDTAIGIHYRNVLSAYGQKDGSRLDLALGEALKPLIEKLTQNGPGDEHGRPVFKFLDAAASVEIKMVGADKGDGLRAIVDNVIGGGQDYSSVVFCGDDVCKNGRPGTDYDAMIMAEKLQEEYAINVFNIHTHHPVIDPDRRIEQGAPRQARSNLVPDPARTPDNLGIGYEKPRIDLRVPSPLMLVGLIMQAVQAPLLPSPRTPRKRPEHRHVL